MPYIDVEINDLIDEMNHKEIQDLVDDLYEDGFVPSKLEECVNEKKSVGNIFLQQKWNELFQQLSENEIEQILKKHNLIIQ